MSRVNRKNRQQPLTVGLTAATLICAASLPVQQSNSGQDARAQAPSFNKAIAEVSRRVGEPDKNFSKSDGSGELLAMVGGKTMGTCPLKHTTVKADISGYVARVSVKQKFHNTFSTKIEAVYTFPLPEHAAVDEMTMTIGKRVIKGVIKKREEAREIYENAKAHGQVASLLDQERPNIFTQSVANIDPNAEVEIEIKYVDLLPYESGKFTFAFPTVVGPRFNPGASIGKSGTGRDADTNLVPDASRITPQVAAEGQRAGHDISIDVNIAAGVPIVDLQSKLHEVVTDKDGDHAHISLAKKSSIPNKDFVLSWTVAKDSLGSGYLTHRDEKSGYFTLMLLPPKRVTPETAAPKEMVFLIDCSGSQSGAPLDKAKETMEYIVDHMNPNDTFQVLAFNNQVAQFAPKPAKADDDMKKRAKAWIKRLEANGGTWMAPAVEKVCSMPADENRLRIVVFMTDGYVGNDFEIRGMVRKFRGTSRWFPFGTGNSVNRFLIDGIAEDGGGEAEYVLLNSPGPVVGEKFYSRISSPVLTDVKLNFNGLPVKEVYPVEVSDVWAERPLYFKGRYTAPTSGTITLSGFSAGKPYKQDLKVNFPEKQDANSVIKSIWARAKVDRLMAEDWIGAQRGSVNKELRDEIVQTALDYHLLTQYTSFVAVEEKQATTDGKPVTVPVNVEMPEGVSREMTVAPPVGQSINMPTASCASRTFGGKGQTRLPPTKLSSYVVGAGSGGAGNGGATALPSAGAAVGDRSSWSGAAVGSGGGPASEMVLQKQASGVPEHYFNNAAQDPATAPVSTTKRKVAPAAKDEIDLATASGEGHSGAEFEESAKKPATIEQKKEAPKEDRDSSSALADKRISATLLQLIARHREGRKMDAKTDVQVNGNRVAVKLKMSKINASILSKLKELGFELVKRSGQELIGRIEIANLEKLGDLKELVSVEPAKI